MAVESKIKRAIDAAYESDSPELIKALIDDGSDINTLINTVGSLLHLAVLHNAIKIANWLVENGTNINIIDRFGQTPLYYSTYPGKEAFAQLLIASKADINLAYEIKNGCSPLIGAIHYNNYALAAKLVELGAVIKCKGSKNNTLISAALADTPHFIHLLADNGMVIPADSPCISVAILAQQPANALTLINLGASIGLNEDGEPDSITAQAKYYEESSQCEENDREISPEKAEQWETLLRQLEILEEKSKPFIDPERTSPGSSVISTTANLAATLSTRGIK